MSRSPFEPPNSIFEVAAGDGDSNGYPYLGRLYANGVLIAQVGLEAAHGGLQKLQAMYAKTFPAFDNLVTSLGDELHWSQEVVLALAITFVSPALPPHVVAWQDTQERTVGRPPTANRLTRQIYLLGRAWELVTGKKPATSEETLFVRALGAAAPYLPLCNRRGEVVSRENLHEIVRREVTRKIRSPRFRLAAPLWRRIKPPT